jgi:MerR family redox-sensitive transcriptional activator SoxR
MRRCADRDASKTDEQLSCGAHALTVRLEVDFKSRDWTMTIGELAAKSGLPASTIRYWERIGVLPRPMRSAGQRRYSGEAVQRLAVLRLAQACGFRLEEMRDLLHGFGPGVTPRLRWQKLARQKRQEIDGQIARLNAMRRLVDRVLECGCNDLSECGRIARSVLKAAE